MDSPPQRTIRCDEIPTVGTFYIIEGRNYNYFLLSIRNGCDPILEPYDFDKWENLDYLLEEEKLIKLKLLCGNDL